jgi:hypothetical protein
MLHIPPLLSALLLGATSVSAASTCPLQPRTEAGAIATENAWVSALERRDSAALDCILDPAFSDNDWRGEQVSRAAVLARLPQQAPSTLHRSELKTTVEDSMAVVRGLNTQMAADGKITGAVRFTDVFVYRDHRWRAVAAQETLVRPAE